MRWLVMGAAIAAVGWTLWWLGASWALRGSVAGWLEDRRAEGWQAEAAAITGGGFPLDLVAGLQDLALADPETGLALRMAVLDIRAAATWPGQVRVALADAPIALASPRGASELTMQGGALALDLAPRRGLDLRHLGWTAGPWQVADAAGTLMRAQDLHLTMTLQEARRYRLDARAAGFAPGAAARAGLRLPDSFPDAFDSLGLTAEVTFDRPWDARALSERRPQPRRIDLTLAEARWGDLSLNVAAALDVDADGVPEGTVSLQAENWRRMLDLAEGSGALPPAFRAQAETVLAALARASGNANSLDLELVLRGGAVRLGLIPIAPAPVLLLR